MVFSRASSIGKMDELVKNLDKENIGKNEENRSLFCVKSRVKTCFSAFMPAEAYHLLRQRLCLMSRYALCWRVKSTELARHSVPFASLGNASFSVIFCISLSDSVL